MKPARSFASLVLACLAVPALAAQTPAASPAQTLPADPAALLQLASQVNGLHGSDLKPWHARATWQTLDDQKQVKDQGTWEEWWAAEKKYKITWKSATVDRTFYGTDHGRYFAQRTDGTSWQFATVERLIQTPVIASDFAAPMKTTRQAFDMQQGNVPMHCAVQAPLQSDGQPVMVFDQNRKSHPMEFRYCFSGDLPAVRAERVSDGGQTVFNSMIRFQGQYLAQRVRSVGAGGTETDISLDLVEPIGTVADADFVPPPDAQLEPVVKKIALSSALAQGLRIGGNPLRYPQKALAERLQGTVVLTATISTQGAIADLSVVSGPPELRSAALEAVRTWKYKPYLLNGQPVEVETQINVIFSLGR